MAPRSRALETCKRWAPDTTLLECRFGNGKALDFTSPGRIVFSKNLFPLPSRTDGTWYRARLRLASPGLNSFLVFFTNTTFGWNDGFCDVSPSLVLSWVVYF